MRIRGRFNYFTIMIALCICASINSTEEKSGVPFEKKMVLDKMIIEETGDETDQFPLDRPLSFTQDSKGNIYILDSGNHCIVKYSAEGKYIKNWGKEGQGPGEFLFSGSGDSICITSNDIIYVADKRTYKIQSFDTEGKILSSFITERCPDSICIDSKGNILISHALSSENDKLIYIYNIRGETINRFGTPIVKTVNYWFNRSFLTLDIEGNIYQVFEYLPVIRKYSSDGKMIFERKIDLRKCKSIEHEADFWFDYKLDETKEKQRIFSGGIFSKDSFIFVFLADIYVLSKDGEVIGLHEYDSNLSHFILPQQTKIDQKTNRFLTLFDGQDRVGVALFER